MRLREKVHHPHREGTGKVRTSEQNETFEATDFLIILT